VDGAIAPVCFWQCCDIYCLLVLQQRQIEPTSTNRPAACGRYVAAMLPYSGRDSTVKKPSSISDPTVRKPSSVSEGGRAGGSVAEVEVEIGRRSTLEGTSRRLSMVSRLVPKRSRGSLRGQHPPNVCPPQLAHEDVGGCRPIHAAVMRCTAANAVGSLLLRYSGADLLSASHNGR
jgi:hypothetical protein